ARTAARLEQIAEQRNRTQHRNAILALGDRIRHQSAQDDDAAVLDQHGGLDGTFVGRDVGRIGDLGAGGGVFLLDLELHRIAFVDVRRDLEDGAHFLALNGLEGAGGAGDARGGIGVGARDQRDFLRDLHLGLLVVHGDQRGRGNDVAAAVAAQRLNQRGKARAGIDHAADGDRGAGADGGTGDGRGDARGARGGAAADDGRGQVHDAGAGPGKIDDAGRNRGVALSEQQPLHAQIRTLVDVHLDDEGLDLYLRAANVELVDHRHQRFHDLGGRRDDERIGCDVRPDGDAGIDIRGAGWGSTRRRGSALRLGGGGGLALELVGDLFRIGIAQVAHLRVAAGGERRVHFEGQRLELQALRLLAGQQYAVGAFVGDDFDRRARALGALALIQRIDDAHNVGRAGVVQREHLDGFIAALVHALDDAHDAVHVAGAVRDDQHVAG